MIVIEGIAYPLWGVFHNLLQEFKCKMLSSFLFPQAVKMDGHFKDRRKTYSNEFKLQVCRMVDERGNLDLVARELGIHRRCVVVASASALHTLLIVL